MSNSSSLSRRWTAAAATFLSSGRPSGQGVSLDAAGLVALADLKSIADRTAITGTASFLDVFFLAPGIHRQENATEINGGEFPATAALTSGYVFRVENPATVGYLQSIGKSGHLVNVFVELDPAYKKGASLLLKIRSFFLNPSMTASILYLFGPMITVVSLVVMVMMEDWWGLGIIVMLMIARLCNVIVIRRRSVMGWKGVPEPGVKGDLLILLSQDRWVRMRGQVDDLKAVTAGQWLQDATPIEGFIVAASTLLIYVVAALAGNASGGGSLVILCLLLVSAAFLGLSNSTAKRLQMFGRILRTQGEPKLYRRRLDLVDELIKEHKRNDWAISLGMIVPKNGVDVGEKVVL